MANQYILRTLGCKANLYDSQLIEQELQKRGWEPSSSSSSTLKGEATLCIVNSCSVTDEADKQSRKMATRLSRENPNAVVVMTGCGAEINPSTLSQVKGVDYVVGNQNKNEILDLVFNKLETPIPSDILSSKILGSTSDYSQILSKHPHERDWPSATDSFRTPPTKLIGYAAKTRSFLKIQEGCNAFCTYCIIPYGRGPSRSIRPREVIEQIRTLVSQGIKEVILTGTNIGDYGADWNSQTSAFDELLDLILTETDLPRLRISSLDPTEITPTLFSLMERNPRLCPHFHVSLQSPHSRILKLMKRKYGFDEVKECLEKIATLSHRLENSPGGVFVGMDVITGFPGESTEEFEWTFETLSSLPWSRLHVFPYSERSGTPATRLPAAVPREIRIERARKLSQLSLDRLIGHYRAILKKCQESGSPLNSVLIEKSGEGQWISGYTPHYVRVLLPAGTVIQQNQLVSVTPIDLMIDSKNSDVALISRLTGVD